MDPGKVLTVVKSAVPPKAILAISRKALVLQKHSPTIMFAAGVTGTVTSTVLACKSTLKIGEVLDHHDNMKEKAKGALDGTLSIKAGETYSDFDYKKDMYVLHVQTSVKILKLYGPALLLGAASIALLVGSHKTLMNRNAALTAAYAALENSFSRYRKIVRDEIGEDKERQLHYMAEHENASETIASKTAKNLAERPNNYSQYARFFDESCMDWKRTPAHNFQFLRNQQTWANDKLRARGHLFLNEVYDMLGYDRTTEGAVVGWVMAKNSTGDNFVDFGIFEGNTPARRMFINGTEASILLDFNVDGTIFDKI